MTVTFLNLVGDFENLDKTIAFHLESDWTETNIPVFENGTDEPDYRAQFDRSGPNAVLVNVVEDDYSNTDDEANSDTVHSVTTTVTITIVAESREMRYIMENEVNRILWEMSPNTNTRVNKSNDTESSHISYFEKSEVSFAQVDLPDDSTAYLQGSEGELKCVYYKFRS